MLALVTFANAVNCTCKLAVLSTQLQEHGTFIKVEKDKLEVELATPVTVALAAGTTTLFFKSCILINSAFVGTTSAFTSTK